MPVIAVVGPPRVGKTTFLHSIYYSLLRRQARFFIHRACPDGEGIWTSEVSNGKEIARRFKTNFSDEFVNYTIISIRNLRRSFDIVLVDCGGRISEENRRILRECDYAIIIAPDEALAEWCRFVEETGCRVLLSLPPFPPNVDIDRVVDRLFEISSSS